MSRRPITRVVDHQLIPLAPAGGVLSPIVVGTDAWYAWLNAPETRSFTYEGKLTVRRELRHGCWYWYAYRARQGKLYKAYLGKAEELSPQQLQQALSKLSGDVPAQRDRPRALPRPLLLHAKLIPPPAPEHLVSRPRLLRLLHVKPLTLLCAPAGFGKTTLLAEWVAQSGLPCAWIALDRQDNDPQQFLAYLLGALHQAQPKGDDNVYSGFPHLAGHSLTELLPTLLNMLAERPDQLTIVFDNFQVIENPSIHDALALLFAHLPSQVHVLIASRGAIACPLARLRAAGQVSELGAEALRFTHTEIEQVLLADANSPLEPTEVNTLEQCTEGWIAGVRLLLLARQEQQMQLLPGHITQYHALQSYILEEVLTPQPEPIQSFLLETALLGRVNAALCRAVTGQADGERLLERLERAQLFLFSCREQPGWYRYHPVLTNALRHHQEMTQPEHGALLLRRASRWFEKQGALEQAIEYALAARDHPRAAALVERIAAEVFARGEITTLHHWLDALPGAVVRASPRLCIANVWLVFITSQPEEFLEWVEAAELALSAQRQPLSPLVFGEIQAELVGLRAMYQLSFGEFAKAIAACEQAMAQVPPKNSYLRALLLMVLGFAHLRGVNIRLGAQAMAQASNILQITRHALLLPYVIIGQAESYLAQCDLPHAAACCRQILTLATEQNVPALFSAGLAHGLLGEIFWEWNNLEMARSHALQAWDLATQTQTVKTLLLSSLLLALITHAQGEAQETAYWLRQIESSAPKVGLTERLAFISALRAGFSLKDGHLESALAWMRDYRPSWDELTTLTNEFAQCTQARTLLAAGRAYADKAYAEQALILLERVRTTAEEVGRVRSLLEMLVLQALALQLTGDTTAALEVLGRAVALAESGRYIRLFVSEGDPLARLLRQLLDQQRAQKGAGQTVSLTYLANLLKAFAPVGSLPVSPVAGEPLLDPLSWREHEVLRLIATGRKNREIADELVVVTGTVKAHINTIYQKLGVKSRVQAIVRARSLGLL